jgi:hypothetical protein
MKRAVVSLFLIVILTGCSSETQPIVILDGWWTPDFAKEACRIADPRFNGSEYVNVVEACKFDAAEQARDFEMVIASQFAVDPLCKGVAFAKFSGPSDSNPLFQKAHWTLILDYQPGYRNQHWSVIRRQPNG